MTKEEARDEAEDVTKEEAKYETDDRDAIVTEDSYISENISITITTLERHETQVYVADVVLQDAPYLRTGLAGALLGEMSAKNISNCAGQRSDSGNQWRLLWIS